MVEPKKYGNKQRTRSQIGRSNSRRGKAHERVVAKMLTQWTGTAFRRRRAEGRDLSTIARESTADVIAVYSEFDCSVEAKCGGGFSMDATLGNPVGSTFGQWWAQTCYDAKILSDFLGRPIYPLLLFKPHTGSYCVAVSARAAHLLPGADWPRFEMHVYDHLGEVKYNAAHVGKPKMVDLKLDAVIICRWADWLKHVPPRPFFHRYVAAPPTEAGGQEAT